MATIRGLVPLVVLGGWLLLVDLDATDLWSSHEARSAQHAQLMLDDGGWLLPRLYDGQTDYQKPPAFYWLVAATSQLRGGPVDRWDVRLPAALSGLITVLLVSSWLTRRGRPLAGMLAGLILLSAVHFTSSARTGRIDLPLTLAITAGVLSLAPPVTARWRGVIFAGLAFGTALLLKGPIGLVLPVGALATCYLVHRDRAGLLRLGVAVLLAVAIAMPWYVLVNQRTDGEFVRVFFGYHHFSRALGDAPALELHPWWFYGPRFALDFLPWTPLFLFAAFRRDRDDREAAFGLIWFAVMFGLLSLASFKRGDYLLPAFPGAALAIGCTAERFLQRLSDRGRRLAAMSFALMLVGVVIGWQWFHQRIEPGQQAVREQAGFARYIRQQTPAPASVTLFRVESHLLAYHLGRPVHTLVEWGDLNQELARPGTHWFVTREEFVPECLECVRTRPIEVVGRSREFTTAVPLRPLVLLRTSDPPCPTPTPTD